MTRLVQITDLHLLSDPAQTLKDVATRKTFARVLDRVQQVVPDAVKLIITGDLAHDEQPQTYEHLRVALGDWLDRCCIVPGNHDDRALIRLMFPDAVSPDGPYATFSTQVAGWHLLGLDTHMPGQVHGEVAIDQMEWMQRSLNKLPASPTIVFMHHPPLAIGTPWLDRIGLANARAFLDRISPHQQIQMICSGHVHQEVHRPWRQLQFVTTPSTGVQFVPGTDQLSIDPAPPGFRVIELEELRTWVVRVE